ncbi:hypothetical protein O6H91_15G030400 [Diphasiastrum complanatum]|uniref:Uncharacterized protein n=1 Tax=Diphasiastrum complanatum TaxID=34168 RepID=A0ACC2BHS1_DIPCM|nr:hypothetical protein O6H91_15G030400 [Diphasiastrum complanatum]
MALWMESGSEPASEQEKADLDAIDALRESAAIELKEQGNEFVKNGKLQEALDCYTRAIDQKTSSSVDTSIFYGNRAQVHLLLGNHKRALLDAEEAIKRNPANGYYRGGKAALSLGMLLEALKICTDGLNQDPSNQEILKLRVQAENNCIQLAECKKHFLEAHSKAKALSFALASRSIKVGRHLYEEQTRLRKPSLDYDNIFHWPVLFLYGEAMASDFIEDFAEFDTFAMHLDMMFGTSAPPLAWDERHEYSRDNIELYYQANAVPALSRRKVEQILVGDSTGYGMLISEEEDVDADAADDDVHLEGVFASGKPTWVKIKETQTLHGALKLSDFVVPGIPVFYVLAKGSHFRDSFISGKWCPP